MPKPRRLKGYPEPGQWVWNQTQGLPKVYPPEPLPDGLLSEEEVFEHIAYEGLGHCLHCFSSERIEGATLKKLWREAQKASSAIIVHLEKIEQNHSTRKRVIKGSRAKPVKPTKKRKSLEPPEALDFGEDATEETKF